MKVDSNRKSDYKNRNIIFSNSLTLYKYILKFKKNLF